MTAFLDLLHKKHYACTMIEGMWSSIVFVGRMIGKEPTDLMKVHFAYVKQKGKELTDNRLPVFKKLLVQLQGAADKVLIDFNAILAKAVFIFTYTFSMRICEYSNTK